MAIRVGNKFQMMNDARNNETLRLAWNAIDQIAALAAVAVGLLLIFLLDVKFLIAVLFSLGVYAGVTLLRPRNPPPPPPAPPVPPEQLAYETARKDAASMRESIDRVPKASLRKCLSALTDEVDKMLNVIEEDTERGSMMVAPVYNSRLVQPFWKLLEQALWLNDRGVNGADAFLARIEKSVCPKTLSVSQEFYQQYHQQAVLDLATLSEILEHLLDTFDQASVDETDEDL